MTAPQPKPPILDINRFSVTQMVSFSFYIVAFTEFFSRYDPARGGVGELLPSALCGALSKDGRVDYYLPRFIIISIICVNAIRYYLSFWLIELDEKFKQLRAKLSPSFQVVEWVLRAV